MDEIPTKHYRGASFISHFYKQGFCLNQGKKNPVFSHFRIYWSFEKMNGKISGFYLLNFYNCSVIPR